MPPVVETGERPVMVPPMTTKGSQFNRVQAAHGFRHARDGGKQGREDNAKAGRKEAHNTSRSSHDGASCKGRHERRQGKGQQFDSAGLDDDAHKGTDAGNHDKNAPGHAFKALTFASAMEHKKDRRHGKGDQTDIELKKDNQDAHDDKARKGQELLLLKDSCSPSSASSGTVTRQPL